MPFRLPTSPYGNASWYLLAAGVLALAFQFALPTYAIWFVPEAPGPSFEWQWRSDEVEFARAFEHWVDSAGPWVNVWGAVAVVGAGLLLLVPGFVAMSATAARGLGLAGGTIGLAGSFMVLMAEGYDLDALVALLNLGNGGDLEIALPVNAIPVFAFAAIAFACSLRILRLITPRQTRDEVRQNHRAAWLALALMVAVLALPWSLLDPPEAASLDSESHRWVATFPVLAGVAYDHEPGTAWDGLAYSVTVFLTTAWVTVAASVLAGLAPLVARVQGAAGLARALAAAPFATAFMLLWSAVLYVLCWTTYFRPSEGAQHYQPGILNILVLGAAIPLGIHTFRACRAWLRGTPSWLADSAATLAPSAKT